MSKYSKSGEFGRVPGPERLVGIRQVQLGPSCEAKGLYSNPDGTPVTCSPKLALVDPFHTYGSFSTICENCRPHVEKDLLDSFRDRTNFGIRENSENITLPGGLEEKLREEAIPGSSKKQQKQKKDKEDMDFLNAFLNSEEFKEGK